MSRKRFFLILTFLGLGAAWRWARNPMGLKLAQWQRALAQSYGPQNAADLAARVRRRYDGLLADTPYQPNRALRMHLEQFILPGLALYQVLRAEMGDSPTALVETARLFRTSAGLRLLPVRFLRLLSNPFPLFRQANLRLLARRYPAQGWDFVMVEDSPRRLAYDARRCFYLDTLRHYNTPELAPLFCQVDDWMMAELPPSIEWRRTRTMARGDETCNFDWVNLKAL